MRSITVALFLAFAAALSACDDSTNFQIEPLLSSDTVELGAPSPGSALPSALDVTVGIGGIVGGRFPERQADAEEWDVAVRIRNGELVLVPAPALGLNSRASITPAIQNRTFDSLIEAPGRSSFVTDSAVVLRVGSVYAIQSRDIIGNFGTCAQYAKIQPLSVDVAQGRARIQITTNERCGDPRLALED